MCHTALLYPEDVHGRAGKQAGRHERVEASALFFFCFRFRKGHTLYELAANESNVPLPICLFE